MLKSALALASLSLLLPHAAHAMGKRPAFLGGQGQKVEVGNYVVAADVPANQSRQLAKDLAALQSLRLQENDEDLRRVMELERIDPATLDQWLSQRVRYIVSEDLDLTKAVRRLPDPFTYDHPGKFPLLAPPALSNPASLLHAEGRAVIVMANVGTALYLNGKNQNALTGLDIPGVGVVPLRSPRTGVIQIGRGMFEPMLERYGVKDQNNDAYSLHRLAVLFHEARHSDGHGETLGMVHSFCPIGHDMAGTPACDNSLNGAYTVGGHILANMARSCETCTTAEREALRLEALDSYSRVLKEAPKYVMMGQVQNLCRAFEAVKQRPDMASRIPPMVRESCEQLAAHPEVLEIVPATMLDARPEGQR